MKFDHKHISQNVEVEKWIEENIFEFSTGCDEGYQTTLSMDYMQEVANYPLDQNDLRVIFIAEDTFSARQAYLCLINRFMRKKHQGWQNSKYASLIDTPEDGTSAEKVIVITDKLFQEHFEADEKERNNSSNWKQRNKLPLVNADTVLYEI